MVSPTKMGQRIWTAMAVSSECASSIRMVGGSPSRTTTARWCAARAEIEAASPTRSTQRGSTTMATVRSTKTASAASTAANRNFPSNWHPSQFASGPFPLSEPETHALVRYITERPNIAAIHTYHTSGGMILRFPTLAGQDWDYPATDLADYEKIGEDGVEHTGYTHFAGDKQAIIDRMNPGHGVFNDWASNVFGVPAITTEMWRRSAGQGEPARLAASDDGSSPAKFVAWRSFEHPQLGEVEIGGWDRWIASSPPEPLLAEELERNNRWLLTFVDKTPRIDVVSVAVNPSTTGGFEVELSVANVGWLATATAHASEVLQIAKPVVVRIELSNASLVRGEENIALGVLPGQRGSAPVTRIISWGLSLDDASRPASARVVVSSEKAGTVRRTIELNRAP